MEIDESRVWWQQEGTLREILPHVSQSWRCEEQIERCDYLSKAANKASSAYFQHRRHLGQLNETEVSGRSDRQAIRELLVRGLSVDGSGALCRSDPVRQLAELRPYILNHQTLLREEYDPGQLATHIEREASREHRQLENAFRRYSEAPGDEARLEPLLKKIAEILYIVRNNIAHCEKTPKGPDIAKRERDRLVSEVAASVIEELFDLMFDRPSQRLAVYGTLAPGGANTSQLVGLDGCWGDGNVTGRLSMRDGFHSFGWEYPGDEVPVKVLSSPRLRAHLAGLDRFEGPRYCRILVPVRLAGSLAVCNIYEGRA